MAADTGAQLTYERIVEYMNSKRRHTLLLYAWSLFLTRDATNATMEKLNHDGFTLKIKRESNDEIIRDYQFKIPLSTVAECENILHQLHEKSSHVTVPNNTVIVLIIWISAILASYDKKELLDFYLLEELQRLFLYIYQTPTISAYVLLILLVTHTIESLYVSFILHYNVKLSKQSINSWFGGCLLVGYPLTRRAIMLSKLSAKDKNE